MRIQYVIYFDRQSISHHAKDKYLKYKIHLKGFVIFSPSNRFLTNAL